MTKGDPAWGYYEIDASHSPNVTAPEALTASDLSLAVSNDVDAALVEAAQMGADWTMAAIVGCAGLEPVMAAVEAGYPNEQHVERLSRTFVCNTPRALAYCQQIITRPAQTVMVLITDCYEGAGSAGSRRYTKDTKRHAVRNDRNWPPQAALM